MPMYNNSSVSGGGNDLSNITAPIVFKETTTSGNYLLRHQSQASTAGGYEFSFGYNGGAAGSQGPTGEPNYVDDVWWFGFNSAGPDIPVDAAKPTFSLQFESKFAQGGASDPFGSEFHLAFKPVSGSTRRLFTAFMPHDMSTAAKRLALTTGMITASMDFFDPSETSRLAMRFIEGGVGNWNFGSGEVLNFAKLAAANAAPMYQRNAANSAYLPLPYYNGEERLVFAGSFQAVGATPTTGTYANTFALFQATSLPINGTLFQFQAPAVAGDYLAGVWAGSATGTAKIRHSNTSNTSAAHVAIELLAGATGGDPIFQWTSNGARTWTAGIDNSQSDRWVLSSTYELGQSGDVLQITTGNVWFMANCAAAPGSNATGGGNLYVESGALKWRGSSGTITTLGAA